MSMTNCVNCGSAKEESASVCPFCGTSYFDFTDIDLGSRKPCVIRFKQDNMVFQMKAYVTEAEFKFFNDIVDITGLDGTKRYLPANRGVNARIEFASV